jgi:hypothetical protein
MPTACDVHQDASRKRSRASADDVRAMHLLIEDSRYSMLLLHPATSARPVLSRLSTVMQAGQEIAKRLRTEADGAAGRPTVGPDSVLAGLCLLRQLANGEVLHIVNASWSERFVEKLRGEGTVDEATHLCEAAASLAAIPNARATPVPAFRTKAAGAVEASDGSECETAPCPDSLPNSPVPEETIDA